MAGCHRCGDCCRGGFNPANLHDILRLSAFLETPADQIYEKHCRLDDHPLGGRHFFLSKTLEGPCPFLWGNLCSVYRARPLSCANSDFNLLLLTNPLHKIKSVQSVRCHVQDWRAVPDLTDEQMTLNLRQLLERKMTEEYIRRHGDFSERLAVELLSDVSLQKSARLDLVAELQAELPPQEFANLRRLL